MISEVTFSLALQLLAPSQRSLLALRSNYHLCTKEIKNVASLELLLLYIFMVHRE